MLPQNPHTAWAWGELTAIIVVIGITGTNGHGKAQLRFLQEWEVSISGQVRGGDGRLFEGGEI